MMMATPEPISTSTFIRRAKGSSTKAPLNATPSPGTKMTTTSASDQQGDGQVGHRRDDARAAEDADHQQSQRTDRQDDFRQNRQKGKIARHGPRLPLLRHGGELAGGRQRRLIVADQLVDRRGGHVQHRRRIEAEEDRQHHQRRQDGDLAAGQVEDRP